MGHRENNKMARRMFSDEITTSDAFLDMPSESQLLYFHLGMNADDDGFLANTKMIQRTIGASDDSLKLLFAKKFLIAFENGVCVIKHWRINNYIRKDIYKETKYLTHKNKLFLRENGAYSMNPENAIMLPSGHFTLKDVFGKDVENEPMESTSTLRARVRHVDKDRLDKDSKEKNRDISYLENIPEEDISYFKEKLGVTNEQITSKAEDLMNYCKANGKKYKDYRAFLHNALKRDFKKEIVKAKQY